MKTNILVVDNYDSFTWNLVHLVEQLDLPFDLVQNDSIPWANLNGYSHFILSPGPGLPKESGELMKLIDLIASKRPILGVCLGFQALAEHYGMELFNLKDVRHGVSRKLLEMKGPLFKGIHSMEVGLYHSWALLPDSVSENVTVSSHCTDEHIMSFHHTVDPSYGVQFHPESIMSTNGLLLLSNWLEVTQTFPMGELDIG